MIFKYDEEELLYYFTADQLKRYLTLPADGMERRTGTFQIRYRINLLTKREDSESDSLGKKQPHSLC